LKRKVDVLQQLVTSLSEREKISSRHLVQEVADDLVQKYCHIEGEKVVLHCFTPTFSKFDEQLQETFRKSAAEAKVERPWDGEDGCDFKAWKSHRASFDQPQNQDIDVRAAVAALKEQERKMVESVITELPEFNWQGTHNMQQYSNKYVLEYIKGNRRSVD
jgi:hypothetical protein